MNERILELAIEARKYAESKPDIYQVAYDKKFAELIVRECVSIVAKRKNQAIDDSWNVDEAMSMAEMDLEELIEIKV